MADKLNVAVIFGGVSSEYEVSCMSCANVIGILNKDRYNVFPLGVTKDGRWFLVNASADKIKKNEWEGEDCVPAILSPDRSVHGIAVEGGKNIRIDAAFPIMHGKNGEDGAIAALLQLAGIPQVTTTMTSGANCMDKVNTKIFCERAEIPMADWLYFYSHDLRKDVSDAIAKIEAKFHYPVFVKPSSAGSSVGVTKCHDKGELEKGLLEAAKHDFKVLVEEFIKGHEVECAVIGNLEPMASVCGQIAPAVEFYDYDAKYNDDNSALYIPARISEDSAEKLREYAVKVYKTMECQGMARVDFFVPEDGTVIFNEINTIPGFTNISMYPKLMGHTYFEGEALADKLIEYALEKDRI